MKHNYCYVIDEFLYNFKELRNCNNSIWVSHCDGDLPYFNSEIIHMSKLKKIKNNIIRNITKYDRQFKYYKNIVLFSEYDKKSYEKYFKFKK